MAAEVITAAATAAATLIAAAATVVVAVAAATATIAQVAGAAAGAKCVFLSVCSLETLKFVSEIKSCQ